MSVRLNGSGDKLAVASSWGVSTGIFSVGAWVKIINNRSDFSGFFGMGDTNADPSVFWVASSTSAGNVLSLYAGAGEIGSGLAFTMTVGTWYWVVVTRDAGGDLLYRVFDDSTSTTPVDSDTGTEWTDDYTSVDNFVIGQLFSGEWCDAEITNVKVHNGVEWTNAQCRTESQNFEVQTGGGTIWASWRLEDTGADTDGINDGSGNSRNLTNTGCVNGASRPTQLESLGGAFEATPAQGVMDMTGFLPAAGSSQNLTPAQGQLTMTGFAATFSGAGGPQVAAGFGQLTMTGFTPNTRLGLKCAPAFMQFFTAEGISLDVGPTAGVGQITVTGFAPQAVGATSLIAGLGQLTMTGMVPTINIVAGTLPGVGTMTMTGLVPTWSTNAPGGGPGVLLMRMRFRIEAT